MESLESLESLESQESLESLESRFGEYFMHAADSKVNIVKKIIALSTVLISQSCHFVVTKLAYARLFKILMFVIALVAVRSNNAHNKSTTKTTNIYIIVR